MNIIFFTHYSKLYGANKSLISLIEGLRMYGVNSLVIIRNYGELCDVLNEKKISYIIQYSHNWTSLNQNLILNYKHRIINLIRAYLRNIRRNQINEKYLKQLIKKTAFFKADLVYSNSSVLNFGLLFSKKINKPHIWHLREFGKEDYNLCFLDNIKYVKRLLKETSKIISISKAIDNYYIKKFSIRNSNIIYNGVLNIEELKSLDRRRLKIPKTEKGFVFGIVGFIHQNKGQLEAISALSLVCKKYPNSKLIIAGDGNKISLISLIIELGLEKNVEFLGYIQDPFDVFLQIDTLLMCSKNEGLGRVTLEAMASNLPVIGFNSGGTVELIEENKTGLFYEKDHTDLSIQMIKLIENKDLRIELGNNAREIFEKKFTTEIYTKKVLSVIHSIE